MIRISLPDGHTPVEHQLPGRRTNWESVHFDIRAEKDECDFWFVVGDLDRPQSCRCDPKNTILLCEEPPATKRFYNHMFLRQFSEVRTCNPHVSHPGLVLSRIFSTWRVGLDFNHNKSITLDFDTLEKIGIPEKNKLVSVVTSAKTDTKGQRLRLKLIESLQQSLGDQLDVYGTGIRDIGDKWDALASYKYHVALENSRQKLYFTEKLIDPFLAGCLPIYWGCPDIENFFTAESIVQIDVRNPKSVADLILSLIAKDAWSSRRNAIIEARHRILYEYNLFAALNQLCKLRTVAQKQPLTLLPESYCSNRASTLVRKVSNRACAWFSS